MSIKKIKNGGFLSIDVLMTIVVFSTIIILTLTLYGSLREKDIKEKTNYLGFIYHLSLSKGNGVVVYNQKEVLNLQQSVISTLDCNNNYCTPLKKEFPIGSFVSVSYDKGIVNDIKFYSHNFNSIFIENNTTSSFYSDHFYVGEKAIKENPSYVYPLSVQKKITHEYYLENNLNHFLSKDDCILAGLNCLDVLHYKL